MNIKPKFVKSLILIVLIFIVANQLIWIKNMYDNYEEDLFFRTNQSLQQAVLMEVSERHELTGGFIVFSPKLGFPDDTTRYMMKEVRGEDSTYIFQIDRYDPHTNMKIVQFFCKEELPVNLEVVQTLFRNELSQSYSLKNSYLEYLDLTNDSIIKSNRTADLDGNYLRSDTLVMDIASTIGMLAYVEKPQSIILGKMTLQLFLSIILIIIAIAFLIYLTRSLVRQWRAEKLRQDSINAMTHEFKRPLSAALALLDSIPGELKENDIAEAKESAEGTIREIKKLDAYVKQIQRINNNDRGNIVLHKATIDIRSFFKNIYCRYTYSNPPIQIDLSVNTKRETFTVDLLHLSNVIDNLIENGIKYSIDVPKISLEVYDAQDGVAICVSDEGIGISKEDQKRLFERYFRSANRNVQQKHGLGLGLTYSKSVIDAHRGQIIVKSELNKGTSFTIIIKNDL